jgi:hypothetical protein
LPQLDQLRGIRCADDRAHCDDEPVFPAQAACGDNHAGPIEPPKHPLVDETIANCLYETMDTNGLRAVLEKIGRGEIHTVAVETPAPSVMAARDNARLNETGNLVQVIRATGFSAPAFAQRGPFDLVLANILANPLRQLATPMARHLAPSALVILSGLLNHQAPAVIAAYRARGLVPSRHLRIEGWSSLLLRKV